MISEGKNIMPDVYRKETHKGHYLQWSSHHLASQKLSVPSSLFNRCETFITDENRKVKREKIKKVF